MKSTSIFPHGTRYNRKEREVGKREGEKFFLKFQKSRADPPFSPFALLWGHISTSELQN